jgi:hypothetical protein
MGPKGVPYTKTNGITDCRSKINHNLVLDLGNGFEYLHCSPES